MRRIWVYLWLTALTFGVYGQTLQFEFVDFDDNRYVFENPAVPGGLTLEGVRYAFTSLESGNWHPLTWLSLMADAEIWGLNPRGFHLTNVLLHLLNTLLLFELLRAMKLNEWVGATVAALFAVHPLHVESVAWVAERKDLLSTLFGLLSLRWYVQHCARARSRWLTASLLAYLCSLMSKQTLVTLPFLLLLLDVWPLRREVAAPARNPDSGRDEISTSPADAGFLQRSGPELLREKLPFFLLAGLFCVIAYASQQYGGNVAGHRLPPLLRYANAALAYWIYLRRTFWPSDLAAYYPHPAGQLPFALASLAAVALIAVTCAAVVQRERRPWFFVGWLWYVGTLVPVIGIVQIGSQALADRYTYIPLIGIFLAFAAGVDAVTAGCPRLRLLAGFAAIVLPLVAAKVAFEQAATWRNTVALFRHAVEVDDDNMFAHSRLGHALHAQGQYAEAFGFLLKAAASEADAHTQMGDLYAAEGNVAAAARHYRQALRADPNWLPADEGLSRLPKSPPSTND